MEMAAVIHERDRRIYFVDLLQMNDVPTRAHARVKVVVQKLQRKTELDCIESDRRREIRRPQLADDVGDLHCTSSVRESSTRPRLLRIAETKPHNERRISRISSDRIESRMHPQQK